MTPDSMRPRRRRRSSRAAVSLPALLLLVLAITCQTVAAKRGAKTIEKAFEPGQGGITERTVPLRTHSIYAPYVDSDLQNRWFDFGGSAIINTNKHIRLSQDRKSQAGWLWSRLPVTPTSFEIEFEFRVDGHSNSLYGDGFAMWLTKDRATFGPVFGSMDRWDGLGIMFDTYANSRHSYSFPEVVAILNDGTKTYDVGKDGAGQEAGRCSIDYRRTEITAKGKLTYFKNHFLELSLQHEEWDKWTTCFTLKNVTLPPTIYMGFSAHTGDVTDEHDIISVSTHNVVWHPPVPGSATKKGGKRSLLRGGSSSNGMPYNTYGDRKGSSLAGWLFAIIKWLFIVVVLVVAVIVFRGYRSKKSAKRF